MATGSEVLTHYRPDGGWIIYGDDYDGIIWESCEPMTQSQFNDGFKVVDELKQTESTAKATARTALLERLGITEAEAELLK